MWDLHGLTALNFFFPPFFIHHFDHAILRALRKRRPNYLSCALCRSLPEIAGDIGLQVIVSSTASVTADGTGHGAGMVMRPAGTGRLSAR